MQLDIADVAFQGFRLLWKKPLVVVAWGLAYFVGMVVLVLGAGVIFYLGAPGGASPFSNPLTGAGGIVFLVAGFLMLSSMMLCAAYRVVLRPDAGAFAYLRISMTELRMSLFLLGVLLIALVIAIILSLLLGMTVGLALAGNDSAALVVPLIAWIILAVLAVRFSLAPVINFAEGRFGLIESWELTRGNFWRLFAVYLILIVFGIGLSLLVGFVGGVAQAAMGMPNPWAAWMDSASGLAPAATAASPVTQFVAVMVGLGINLVAAAINNMVLYAPHAAAYRNLTAPPAEATGEVFS